MPNHMEHALDVYVDDLGKLVFIHLPKRRGAIHQRGVVDQQIGRTAGQHPLGPGRDLSCPADIDRGEIMRRGIASRQLLEGRRRPRTAADHAAVGDEPLDHGPAQASARAGQHNATRVKRLHRSTSARRSPRFR